MPQIPCKCGKSFWSKDGEDSSCSKCIQNLGGSNRTISRQFFHRGRGKTVVPHTVVLLNETFLAEATITE